MHRLLFSITVFALSFVAVSQILRIFRNEADPITWVLLFFSIAGFLAVLQWRNRNAPPPPPRT
ncbi:hypothetical protein [Granulicoccus sp. GXG6511]|uniref:hypothetical protein n=1 Tax=Granulicoccus sp. GXG6511 TaxID=3381351 RepID=UPI003D7E30D2